MAAYTKITALRVNHVSNPTGRPGGERHSLTVTPEDGSPYHVTVNPDQLHRMNGEISRHGFTYTPETLAALNRAEKRANR